MSIHNMHKIQGQVLDGCKNDAQPTRSHRQVTYVTSNASSPAVTQETTQMHTQTQHTHTMLCALWLICTREQQSVNEMHLSWPVHHVDVLVCNLCCTV